ncbi:PspA/IM30 family protein [Aurantimonas sp. VKM B-3413]|uniref:PspA/IM30 family protein n=1 Tax=Aurantimonas sp. VKM B-3413 TaxID=2779401 RepID=UPI001E4A8962|nr:PspA/IM30 family protein [Aurantimonas sp. VKM B-3413]MCB8835905.1 PspA/IM30 family protein [Aurantimonas sp. VKM B-3413]
MFRLFTTIARGRAHEAAEAVAARHARTILDQQIREAAAALDDARRALALSEASLVREEEAVRALDVRIRDIETRVVAALDKGLEDLASDGAQEIADMECERALCREGIEKMRAEIAARRPYLRRCETRLRRLSRGRDLVAVRARVQSLSARPDTTSLATLSEAEATLAGLEDAQTAEDALAAEATVCRQSPVEDRLAAAGCGPAREGSADAVLDRLRARRNDAA